MQARGWLTTINPLVKLAATFPTLMLLFFTRDIFTPTLVAVLALILLLSGLRVRTRTLSIAAAIMLIVGAWTALLFALLSRAELTADTPIVFEGWVTLRAGALKVGVATALRLIAVSLLALLGSAGTTIAGLNSALVRQLRVPYRFAHGTLAAARFVPRYRDDLVNLRAAHRARGIIDPRGPVGFFRRSSRSIIPLLAGGARYAERLSLSMDARGFGAHPSRSDRHPAILRARDLGFLVGTWLLFAAVFLTARLLGVSEWSGEIHGY